MKPWPSLIGFTFFIIALIAARMNRKAAVLLWSFPFIELVIILGATSIAGKKSVVSSALKSMLIQSVMMLMLYMLLGPLSAPAATTAAVITWAVAAGVYMNTSNTANT